MSNRKKAEALIIKYVTKLEQGNSNAEMYKKLFKSLSNAQFEEYIKSLEAGGYVSMIVPNNSSVKLDMSNNIKVGEELGVNYFQRVLLTDPTTNEANLSNVEYMVLHLPVRRQSQHLIKKRSIPEGSSKLDHITGQVTGEDKGSRVSLPELLALESRGFEDSLVELFKVRGGDGAAYAEMRRNIKEQGTFRTGPILDLDTKPTSTQTLSTLLKAMHLDNNL